MKKTTTTQAKVNTAKARTAATQTAKSFKTETKTVQIDVTTVQLYDDVSVTIETNTLRKLQSWAFHTYRDLSENYLYFDRGDFAIGYTETELNKMIADAGLLLSLSDPNSDDCYSVTGCNVFESCMGIISICREYINVLHEDIEAEPTDYDEYVDF